MRDQLIKLIEELDINDCMYANCQHCSYELEEGCIQQRFADHLLNNGVVICPYEVGDIIYGIDEDDEINELEIQCIDYENSDLFLTVLCKDFSPSLNKISYKNHSDALFKTREEAEESLKQNLE